MESGHLETEIKLPMATLDGLRERLEAAGFRERVAPQPEESTLWDRGAELREQGCALRLRRYAGKAWLTWKGPKAPDPRFKVRLERESAVEAPEELEAILSALSFRPVLRMVKTRAVLARPGLVACLDRTPFGCYLELEGEAPAIDAALLELGLDADRAETRSYPTLFALHGLGAP